MKNSIFLFIAILIVYYVFFVNCEHYTEFDGKSINVEKLNKSVVRINASIINFNWNKPYLSNSSTSVGTGFFIDNNGYILTCYHVVDKSYKLEITIPGIGQNKYNAEIVAVYPERDIALIKIGNFKNSEFLKLGNSDLIKPTDKVNAVGYMLASDQLKITAGTISGYNNNIIQTDTVINSGNSGGPLLNDKFEVIGINVSKVVSYGVEGVNYAVPIKQFIINKFLFNIKNKIIRAPKLGIICNNINDDFSEYYKIKNNNGYVINRVAQNSPAYKAGLEPGDIILSFDNNLLDNYGMTKIPENIEKVHLDYLVYNKSPADKVSMKIISNKTKKNNEVMLDLSNNDFYKIKYKYPRIENINYIVIAGLVLMDMTLNHIDILSNSNNELLSYKNIENRDTNKIIVTNVIPGSKINTLNIIYPGDVIKSINDIEVNSITDINNVLKQVNYKYIKIVTDQNKIFIISTNNAIAEENYLSEINKYDKYFNKSN
jgi:serine protease Do